MEETWKTALLVVRDDWNTEGAKVENVTDIEE